MTQQEELSDLVAIKNELLSLLEPLDDARINQVPFPGSWTAGQLGEHLLKSYRAIDLPKVQAIPSQRLADEKASQIDSVFLDFTTKYQPPEFIVPSTGRISGRELLEGLRNAADGIAAYVNEHDLSFTCPEFEVIGFGELTAQEWIRFLTAHSKRHVRQLKNILSHL
ncbi:MAG: DinB family protein [Fibrobacteres bacterium]|jgi:hypothetical protein|nr:DinB family protein [Fibrobacterota bacterium]